MPESYVLVVDDNPETLRLFERALESEGIHVRAAPGGDHHRPDDAAHYGVEAGESEGLADVVLQKPVDPLQLAQRVRSLMLS